MGDVEFEDEARRENEIISRGKAKKGGGPINVFIISGGFAPHRGTDVAMLIIAIAAVVLSVYFFFFLGAEEARRAEDRAIIEKYTEIPERFR